MDGAPNDSLEAPTSGEYRPTVEELAALDEADRSGVATPAEVAAAFARFRGHHMSDTRPLAVTGILETCLYVEDIARSREFYQGLFGFETLLADDRISTLEVVPGQVLILFKRGGTTEPIPVGDGFIPPHDGGGRQHFALSIGAGDLEAWRRRLVGQGIAVESEVDWPTGGHSLYFRDPDGLLVELATPGLWAKK